MNDWLSYSVERPKHSASPYRKTFFKATYVLYVVQNNVFNELVCYLASDSMKAAVDVGSWAFGPLPGWAFQVGRHDDAPLPSYLNLSDRPGCVVLAAMQ